MTCGISDRGSVIRHSKSSKKSKGTKRIPERILRDSNSSDSQEILPKQTIPRYGVRKASDALRQSSRRLPIFVKNEVKKPQLEKRKQDPGEWKALKKVDYQRLETVLEEGQLSSEEASSKHNFLESGKSESGSETDHASVKAAPVKSKKSWIYSLMSISEADSAKRKLKQQKLEQINQSHEQIIKTQKREKSFFTETLDSHGEPTEALPRELSQSKRSVILSGMMEILPIFSNDKFVCSRDAISIEEYEDQDLDRNVPGSGKTPPDAKTLDVKPFSSANSVKKVGSFDERFVEKLGDHKETTERKMRYKVFTDKNVSQQTSSPFINSLLMLTPFSSDGKEMNDVKLSDKVEEVDNSAGSTIFPKFNLEGNCLAYMKIFFAVVAATLCLFALLVSIAWRTYQPPRFVDSVLDFIPFIHRRRSYFQIFIEELIKFMSSFFGDMYFNFFYSNRI